MRGERQGTAGTPCTRAILTLERIGRIGIIKPTFGPSPIPPTPRGRTLAPRVFAGLLFLRVWLCDVFNTCRRFSTAAQTPATGSKALSPRD